MGRWGFVVEARVRGHGQFLRLLLITRRILPLLWPLCNFLAGAPLVCGWITVELLADAKY